MFVFSTMWKQTVVSKALFRCLDTKASSHTHSKSKIYCLLQDPIMWKHHKDKKNQDFLATNVHGLNVNEFLKNLLLNILSIPAVSFLRYLSIETNSSFSSSKRVN